MIGGAIEEGIIGALGMMEALGRVVGDINVIHGVPQALALSTGYLRRSKCLPPMT